MAERIKGITIEFDGDVKGLKKALTEVNSSAKKTNKALKDVNNALKLKPNSVTLLTQKQQLLRRRTEEVTDKIKVLKMRLDQMGNDPAVDKKSAEYQKLQRELIKAQAYQKQFAREMVRFGNAKFTAVGNSLMTVGKKLTHVTRRARQAAAALVGFSLYKGFQRLKTLDDVSTELKKLGYQGQKLENVMNAATDSVSGTKYALTDMAKVAKGALGAGVEDAYDLGDYLGRVADLSAVAGVSVDSMGALMNKALSKGRIDAKLLNQMNANGIPIYNLLAQSMGVTKEELDKLVRTGQVGFDDLYKATEKYQGMAQQLGTETLSGAVTVLGQQFGLIGADFLSGAYEPIKDGVQGIVAKLKELRSNGTIKAWGKAVGETIKYFVEWFKNGEASTEGLSGKAQKLISAFSPVVKIIGTLVQVFMALPGPIKMLIAAFALFGGPVLMVVGAFIRLLGMISAFINLVKIVGSVVKAFSLLLGVNPIILGIAAAIAALIAIGIIVWKNWDKIKAFAIKTWDAIKTKITTVVNTIKSALSAGFGAIKGIASRAWNNIKNAIVNPIKTAKNTIKGIVDKLKSFFPLSVGKIFKNLKIPKIKIKGGKAPFGIGGKGTKPSISVSWNKKAMNNPYMFSNATLFGAGEAGDEMLYGRSSLMKDIAAASGSADVVSRLAAIEALLEYYLPMGQQIVMDNGALIGQVNRGLGMKL